jgi:hypothetical protein
MTVVSIVYHENTHPAVAIIVAVFAIGSLDKSGLPGAKPPERHSFLGVTGQR